MTIDTKRLKTDAAYWDECGAPEDATHYCPLSKLFYDDNYPIEPCCIPRPTKPAKPEWNGEGWPPVGFKCEMAYRDSGGKLKWRRCYVIGQDDAGDMVASVAEPSYKYVSAIDSSEFRPIRTKEQREREEVDAVIRKAYLDGASGHIGGLAAITDAILSRYNLEQKP